jgi:capsule polysaccharide export protein KpsE/RkpR
MLRDPISPAEAGVESSAAGPAPLSLLEIVVMLAGRWRSMAAVPLACGVLAVGASFLVKPTFTSEALLLTPSSNQGSLSALAGALGGGAAALVGSGLGGALKDPNDQWIAFLRSRTLADTIIDKFDLLHRYGVEFRFQAREALADRTRIDVTKQGLISLTVDDHDPARAQAMAGMYVSELQRLSNALANTAATKRRVFFEEQLNDAGQRLAAAQSQLGSAGVRDDVIKSSPQATVEAIAEVQRSILAVEVQLSALRSSYTEASPLVQQTQARLGELRRKLADLQRAQVPQSATSAASGALSGGDGYISRYRAYKYAEVVFEGIARQLELARLEEAREGALVQLVDSPTLPEHKSKPKRAFIGVFTAVAVGLLMAAGIVVRERLAALGATPHGARQLRRLRTGLRWRRVTDEN